ncbi:hypothetical protein Glove_648g7 [Diversispora epigaea]|uniref:Ricin B lectin domain-containing protein n=1 Tax=Diversispora epigaea TaxID=1348612 RepID=A0A397G860_9GLOM|nr:hypothetical protein Glove_648g7 [Diversispora epigaea]
MAYVQFPTGDFYIKSASSSSGESINAPPSQNLVVDVEQSFFVSWARDGTKVIIAQQKSDTEHDHNQLWRYDDGWIVNKQTSLCLDAGSGKPGNRIILHSRRSPHQAQANNQCWIFTKDGHIALQSNPKYLIEIKSSATKDGSIILADSRSKNFAKSGLLAQWVLLLIHKKKRRGNV